jgi:hypothetical protein
MMPFPSTADDTDRPVAAASITQILTGHALTDASAILCWDCGDSLTVGDIVFAAASRNGSQYRWRVDRLYCWGCAPATSVAADAESANVILGGRLGTRSDPTGRVDRLCLAEVALRSYSLSPTG